MNPFWSATTPDGTKLDYACSILQKAIRRGEETAAIWATKQIYLGKKAKRYGCDLWRKLYIYAAEEVGLADIIMPLRLTDLERIADRIAVTSTDEVTSNADMLYYVMAVLILCRARKSRGCNEAGHWFEHNTYTPPSPEELDAMVKTDQPKPSDPQFLDDCKDMHTSEGHGMGRHKSECLCAGDSCAYPGVGLDHFLTRGTILENHSDERGMELPDGSFLGKELPGGGFQR
jgi:hypothetical protein